MQVIWILTILGISAGVYSVISLSGNILEVLGVSLAWLTFLIIFQYLIFASIKPTIFFGVEKSRYFTIFVLVCVIGSIIGGVTMKFYNDYEYNKKLEAGNDIVFYDKILKNIIYKHDYDVDDCTSTENPPTARKDDLYSSVDELKKQQVTRLNILVVLADRDNELGRAIRCALYDGIGVKGMAEVAGITY